MPPVLIPIAAAAASLATAGALTAALGATLAGVIGGIVGAVITFSGNALLGATPKTASTTSSLPTGPKGRSVTVRQAIAAWPVIYGAIRTGGVITFIGTSGTNNEFLHLVITLCGHSVKQIGTMYFDGVAVEENGAGQADGTTLNGLVTVERNLGSATQAAFPGLVAALPGQWTEAHTQSGRAGVHVQLTYDATAFPNGVPNITFDVIGNDQVYDWRSASRGFTDNAALCLADYLSNATYGLGADVTAEFSSADAIEAANTCDEIVALTALQIGCTIDVLRNRVVVAAGGFPGGPPAPLLGDQVQIASTGTMPTGLSAGTNYYWFPTEAAENLGLSGYLASSLANARAGVAVAITSAGTGSLVLTRVGEPRYRCDGSFTTDQKPSDIIPTLLTAMGGSAGRAIYVGGLWVIHAGAYRTPTVTLTDADVRKASGYAATTLISARESFNAVKGVYLSPNNSWQPSDYPPVTSATYQAADGGGQVFTDLNLPFTASAEAAQRIATMELNRSRREISIAKFPGKMTAYQVQAGDTVMLSSDFYGWSSKVFDVVASQLTVDQDAAGAPVLGCDLSLREIDSNAFAWSAGNAVGVQSAPKTSLPSPSTVAAPGVPTVTESLYTTRQNAVKSQAAVTWGAAADAYVVSYQLEMSVSGAGDWQVMATTLAPVASATLYDIAPGVYDFRVKAINAAGAASAYATLSVKRIFGLSNVPADPTNFAVNPISGQAVLTWDASPDLDVRQGGYMRVRWSSLQTGATWANAIDVGPQVPGDHTSVVLPLMAGTYLGKWVSSSGIASSNAGAAATNGPTVQTFANSATVTEDPAFSGVKTQMIVNGGDLQLDSVGTWDSIPDIDACTDIDLFGGIFTSGSYQFAGVLNMGAVKQGRVSVSATVTASNVLTTVDSRTNDVDEWDDWDGTTSAIPNLAFSIATTQQDPTGTPTWSAWMRCLSQQDVNCWGIKFKLDAATNDPAYNLLISNLSCQAHW